MTDYTDRQSQIIQESIELIARKGIQGLTIKNIAKAIGISEPAIYRHFESKDDIILGIISVLKDATSQEIEAGTEKKNTIHLIKNMLQSRTNRFIKNPSLTAIVFSEEIFHSSSILAKPIRAIMNMNHNRVITIIEKGQASGEIRRDINATELSLMVIGSFRFLVNKWHLMGYTSDLKAEVHDLLNSLEKILIK